MFAEIYSITLDASWQTLAAAGVKEFFYAANIENVPGNTNTVDFRYKPGGEEQTLNPGDKNRLKTKEHIKEPFRDTGIAVKGTATEIVKVEVWYYDFQGA